MATSPSPLEALRAEVSERVHPALIEQVMNSEVRLHTRREINASCGCSYCKALRPYVRSAIAWKRAKRLVLNQQIFEEDLWLLHGRSMTHLKCALIEEKERILSSSRWKA